MTIDTVRPVDKYDRPIYADHETPPIDERIAVWRGRVVAYGRPYGGNSISGAHDPRFRQKCENGWVASGDWWLHCTVCHPYTEDDTRREHHRHGFHEKCDPATCDKAGR